MLAARALPSLDQLPPTRSILRRDFRKNPLSYVIRRAPFAFDVARMPDYIMLDYRTTAGVGVDLLVGDGLQVLRHRRLDALTKLTRARL